MMKRFVCVLGAALLGLSSGCGGGGNPTGPSNSTPNVVGSYSGNITLALPELSTSVVCPASTTVTQSGTTVSIAPLILRGECGTLSIPVGQVTIDNTGAFQGDTRTTIQDTCGVYNATGSGGFFGRDMRISITATSTTCYNFNFTATLTKS